MTQSPFSSDRDPELGEALRALLSSTDDDAFVHRVLEHLDDVNQSTLPMWEVLADWGRAGVAVAAGIAALGLFAILPIVGQDTNEVIETGAVEAALAEPSSQLPPAVLAASAEPPDPNAVLAAVYDVP